MSDYLDVLGAWLSGRPTVGLNLWGQPMFVWGRWGKAMLFMAGFAVVLDLLDPDKLSKAAARAKDQADDAFGQVRDRRALRRVVRLQTAIFQDVVWGAPRDDRATTKKIFGTVAPTPSRVPSGLRMTLNDYGDFRRRLIGSLPNNHECSSEHAGGVCPAQRAHVRRQADVLLNEQLPEEMSRLIPKANQTIEGNRSFLVFIAAMASVVTFGSLFGAVSGDSRGFILFPFVLVIAIAAYSDQVRLLVASVVHSINGVLQQGLSSFLTRHPWRPLRWAAFILFLIGGQFDLLAS
jgi:hypothetical protein